MNDHVAVVLPGSRYEPIGPAIHVPYLALHQAGAARRVVDYPGYRPDNLDQADIRPFAADVLGGIREAVRSAGRVTFVAKSLGTLVLSELGRELAAEFSGAVRVEAIWVTPLFGLEYVRDGATAAGWRSLVISGEVDEYFDRAGDQAVAEATGGRSLVLPGAEHSLVVEKDVVATVEGWKRVAEAVLEFAGYG